MALSSRRIHVDTRRGQQRRDDLGVAFFRRKHERRVALSSRRIHVDTRRGQQRRDDLLGVALIQSLPHRLNECDGTLFI